MLALCSANFVKTHYSYSPCQATVGNVLHNRADNKKIIRETSGIKNIITIKTIKISHSSITEITGSTYQEIIPTGRFPYSTGKRHLLINQKKGDVLFNSQNYLFSRCICQQI